MSDYNVFFDHIRSALDIPRSSPTVGSDDEKALRNANSPGMKLWPKEPDGLFFEIDMTYELLARSRKVYSSR